MAIHHDGAKPRIFQLLVSHVPKFWRRRFHSKNEIMGSEMLALIAFLWANRPYIRVKRINLYIDNNAAANAIIRGAVQTPCLPQWFVSFGNWSNLIRSTFGLVESLQSLT